MGIFCDVKATVSTKEAVAFYGLKLDRHGYTCCPFHPDKNPSMLVDDTHYYCFGCHATGDVIQFVADYFHMPPWEAAKKLVADFNVPLDPEPPQPKRTYKMPSPQRLAVFQPDLERLAAKEAEAIAQAEAQLKKLWLQATVDVLSRYRLQLEAWKEDYAPQTEDEEWHPNFIKANADALLVDYLLLLADDPLEQDFLYNNYSEEIERIEHDLNHPDDA